MRSGVFVFLALFGMGQAQNSDFVANGRECGECNPNSCPKPGNCPAGFVLDFCNCCLVCGQGEGEKCESPELSLPYKNRYRSCGEYLECKLRIDTPDRGPTEAICVCQEQKPVCGTDGVTYKNICLLREAESKLNIQNNTLLKDWAPCKSAPVISSGPSDDTEALGSKLVDSCEARGNPTPAIHWEFIRDDGTTIVLPGDDPRIAIQTRGGPEPYMVSSWVQIVDLQRTDGGNYICVATNDAGEVKSVSNKGVYNDA